MAHNLQAPARAATAQRPPRPLSRLKLRCSLLKPPSHHPALTSELVEDTTRPSTMIVSRTLTAARRSISAASSATSRSYSVYAWGTSAKGTIPVDEILDEAAGAGGGGSSLLSTGGTKFDIPRQIDVKKAFGIDNESVTVKHVECGPTGTAAILSDGRCFTFGSNENGQLGHGDKVDVLAPKLLEAPESSSLSKSGVSAISLGTNFSAIIDDNGDLYSFGFGGSALSGMGCLGHGDNESHLTPKLVESLIEDGCYAAEVAVGELHMTVLTTEGEVLTTGSGAYGRLGNLETADQLYLEPVELLGGEEVSQICSGLAFSLALTKDGIIHGWGRNDKGQLGVGASLSVDVYAMSALPSPIEGQLEGRTVEKIAAGHSHAAAITDDGELFMWGSGLYLEPQLFPNLLHTEVIDISCGQDYTAALTKEGELYTFGKGKTGVLGLASLKKANQPTLVEGLKGKVVVDISAGWKHFACLVECKDTSGDDDK